jgi:inorganic pyrophosphatase
MTFSVPPDYATRFIGAIVRVTIDRPLGSFHADWPDLRYDLNYGFVEGAPAPDGEPVDAYVLGVDRALSQYEGRCIAVIHRLDDDDDKLVVAPDGAAYDDDEILRQTAFVERWFKPTIVRVAGAPARSPGTPPRSPR